MWDICHKLNLILKRYWPCDKIGPHDGSLLYFPKWPYMSTWVVRFPHLYPWPTDFIKSVAEPNYVVVELSFYNDLTTQYNLQSYIQGESQTFCIKFACVCLCFLDPGVAFSSKSFLCKNFLFVISCRQCFLVFPRSLSSFFLANLCLFFAKTSCLFAAVCVSLCFLDPGVAFFSQIFLVIC